MALMYWDPDNIFEPRIFPMEHYWAPVRPLARAPRLLHDGNKITVDKDKFLVSLDVAHFAPEEITVKTVGGQVVVEGRHEEKADEHGHISRHFVRKYRLPEGCKEEHVVSSLSADGVLSITAPRTDHLAHGERHVPITHTGPVHKALNGGHLK